MSVKTTDNSTYYETLSYESYDSDTSSWFNGSTDALSWKADQTYPTNTLMITPLRQDITIVNPPGEQRPYIIGAPGLAATNMPASVESSKGTGEVLDWLSQNGAFTSGKSYIVVSYVSTADVQTLRSVPLPKDQPVFPPDYDGPPSPFVYDQHIVQTYTQVPGDLDPRIAALAKRETASFSTMYDKVVALETYLRDTYTYDTNIHLPAGDEGVSWFLFNSERGFCNYFASAMTIMARELGIPARVVAGYTNGELDTKTHQRVIHGTDAHAWVQVYFAGYGWINFEPSATFDTFSRPLPTHGSGTGVGSTTGSSNAGSLIPSGSKGRTQQGAGSEATNGSQKPLTAAQAQAQVRQQVGIATGSIALLILCVALLFMLWWRQLFRKYNLSTQLYGRLCMLAGWAGIQLHPSQTPYEYVHGVATSTEHDTLTLERLADIYVRDIWADPQSLEHPRRSGEIAELPGLWRRIQPHLFLYVLRHPLFLRVVPQRIGAFFARLKRRRRERKMWEDF